MRKKICVLATAMAIVLAGCTGTGSSQAETTVEESTSITEITQSSKETTTATEETEKENEDETKEEKDKINKKDLIGSVDEDSYYNPYFNLGFYFNEYWKHKECKNKDYENWKKNDKILAFTPFQANVENNINFIFFNIEKNADKLTADEKTDKYLIMTSAMYEADGFTVEKKEKVTFHLDDEELPTAWIIASQGDVSQHVLSIFKVKDDLTMFIQITGFNDDTLFAVMDMLYKKN